MKYTESDINPFFISTLLFLLFTKWFIKNTIRITVQHMLVLCVSGYFFLLVFYYGANVNHHRPSAHHDDTVIDVTGPMDKNIASSIGR